MCGLILAPDRYESKIPSALSCMAYRGDRLAGHSKCVIGGGWAIGHNRLAIQDLSKEADQPFRDLTRTIAFVGEFFNHGGMGEQQFLSHLLQHPDRFHQADGFWSVVAVQRSLRVAEVYTDHLGIKPLYFWPEHMIVCSEIEPMFALEPAPPLDQIYLSNCIKFGYDYAGRTPYQGIVQLSPGVRLTMDPMGFDQEAYWDWGKVPVGPTLRGDIIEAIENRTISDLPVALLLSGGLDSSIIYYTLKGLGRQVEAFSVENGETEYLPDGVKTLAVPNIPLRQAVRAMQAPMDLGSLLPQIQLAQSLSYQGFRVCMSGDGADEVFGGYNRAKEYDSQASDVFCELPYYHLPRLDRIMMRETIELRSPFLSPKVVAQGLRLPYRYRKEKQALKLAFKGIVPDEIIQRPKHPLKSQAVLQGGVAHRSQLVEEFKNHVRSSIHFQPVGPGDRTQASHALSG